MSANAETPEEQVDECVVICPYCKQSYQPEHEDFSEQVRDEECFSCGKIYVLHQEFTVEHHTSPKVGQ